MSSESVDKGSTDLISSLPDEILGKILSSLPTKVAASTSVLSKRWRNLLVLIDKLDFSDSRGDPRHFCDFVDKTLALLSNSSIIKSFSLFCGSTHDYSRVDSWIRTALDRGVLELDIGTGNFHDIEAESFTSNTLVKLTLFHGFYFVGDLPRDGLFFPKLKTLYIGSGPVEFADMYEHLISGCPLLEELSLHYGDGNNPSVWDDDIFYSIPVSSPSLKRLTISYMFPDYDVCRPAPVSELFHTPSLVYLEISSYVSELYDVDFGSLVEARLDLRSPERDLDFDDDDDSDGDFGEDDNADDDTDDGWGENDDDNNSDSGFVETEDDDDDDGGFSDDDNYSDSDNDLVDVVEAVGDVTDLVAAISNVKTLHLSPDSLEVFHLYCKTMPVFQNLLTLSFESDSGRGWQGLPRVLNNSPNLETLVIQGLVHQVTEKCGDACVCIPDNNNNKKKKKKKQKTKKKMEEEECCLSTCQVKVLNISEYGGTSDELMQMRHFLGNLKYLETVKVGVEAEYRRKGKKYLTITDAVMKLPRVSSKCQIHFF